MAPEFEDFDAALAQACRDIGGGNYKAVAVDYAPTSPQQPRDEQAELQRAFVVAKDELAAILARMEALQGAGGNS